ncbi:MAG: TetR family transcriptional regulator C-terminal domain-containing protein [Pseudomonadota bacterium]
MAKPSIQDSLSGVPDGGKQSRIQTRNREKILEAATHEFAQHGFRGSTVAQIARAAEMSKPNLLYYFASKEDLYLAVLQRILDIWLRPLSELDPEAEPEDALGDYIDQKIEQSRRYPEASRVFANEMTAGAPILKPLLVTYVKEVVNKKARVIRKWIRGNKMNKDVDPYHLIMMIWAVTQHYADFAVQVDAVRGKTLDDKNFYHQTRKNIKNILLHGCLK